MTLLARAGGEAAFSVFANSAETLSSRKAAAVTLSSVLCELSEAQVQGPVRTAVIKCELAALFADTHSKMNDRFCEASALLDKAARQCAAAAGALS